MKSFACFTRVISAGLNGEPAQYRLWWKSNLTLELLSLQRSFQRSRRPIGTRTQQPQSVWSVSGEDIDSRISARRVARPRRSTVPGPQHSRASQTLNCAAMSATRARAQPLICSDCRHRCHSSPRFRLRLQPRVRPRWQGLLFDRTECYRMPRIRMAKPQRARDPKLP